MPEEIIETADLKEQIEQGVERALEHERATPSWTTYLSLSTAIIAVFAAVASLQAGANSNEAILEKNEAVLNESRASDQWAYYQAKGVKAAVAASQAEMVAASNPDLATRTRAEVARYAGEQEEIAKRAHELEAKVKESNERSDHLLERHHVFAIAVTLFQVAIALHAIAALTRRKLLWAVGVLPGAVGMIEFVRGFLSGI